MTADVMVSARSAAPVGSIGQTGNTSPVFSRNARTTPVSYTHLDVYKRQALSSVCICTDFSKSDSFATVDAVVVFPVPGEPVITIILP